MTRGENQNPEEKTLKKVLIIFAGLLVSGLAGFILFIPIPFQSDDYFLISFSQKNPVTFLTNWNDVLRGMYRPVTVFYIYLQFKLFGYAPEFYYLSNLLIHLANTAILYLFLKKILKEKFKISEEIPVLVAVVFFLLRFQSITNVFWISSVTDLLSFLFGMTGLYLWLYFAEKPKYLFPATVLLFLSLLSKETGLVFVFFALVLLWFYRSEAKYHIIALISLFVLVAIYLILRYISLQHEFYNRIDGVLLLKLGYWRNLIPALLLPFDVNDFNFIRWSGNYLLYLFAIPFILLSGFLLYSVRLLWMRNKLNAVFFLSMVSLISMLLYSTYPPASRLTYINSIPLLVALAIIASVFAKRSMITFVVILMVTTVLGTYSELNFQKRQNHFQQELEIALKHHSASEDFLLVFPYSLTAHQKYSFVPLQYASVFWKTGKMDTTSQRFIWPLMQMSNSLPELHYSYKVSVIDSLTIEFDSGTPFVNFLFHQSYATGDSARSLCDNLIDTVLIYNREKDIVKKGPIARIHFNYSGVIQYNLPVLFVRDKSMKIQRLHATLGLKKIE